jgi:uroporphyrin-3 C-methyltransferase
LIALGIALLALAGTALQWRSAAREAAAGRARAEEVERTQRRLNALETRIQRERDDLDRLVQRVGAAGNAEDSLVGRIARLEDAMARMPGGEQARVRWLIEQAEYFMRVANAQETLAGDSAGALTALGIADEHLRDAADPRLTPVRKLVAGEIAALRAVPQVDKEGLALEITVLAGNLAALPLRQSAAAAFAPAPEAAPAASSAGDRILQALRGAFTSIVSIRRTDVPAATLLTEMSAGALVRSLELELQMARLALLRGEAALYRSSLGNVQGSLERYFDTDSPEGSRALAVVGELARAPLPEALPDVSGSLAALRRVEARAGPQGAP